MIDRRRKHWTETLFVHHPELFLPWMEQMKTFAQPQVEGLRKIFQKHGVRGGGRILDLACGLGRISIYLAKAGYNVVGIDISPLYLRLAQKWATKESVDDKTIFYRMDARKAPRLLANREDRFDAVVNMGTSMGFYGEAYDRRVFHSLRAVTSRRGVLVVETVNRDYLVRHFQEQNISEIGKIVWSDARRLDLESSFMRNSWKFYRKERGSLRLIVDVPVSHRVYSLHELRTLLFSGGWDCLESYGSLRELTPLTTDSFHMTLVARRRASASRI